jgi:hypothetical protein
MRCGHNSIEMRMFDFSPPRAESLAEFRFGDAEVRILPPQPTGVVSVGGVRPEKIASTLPRVSEIRDGLCSAIFWNFHRNRLISYASL